MEYIEIETETGKLEVNLPEGDLAKAGPEDFKIWNTIVGMSLSDARIDNIKLGEDLLKFNKINYSKWKVNEQARVCLAIANSIELLYTTYNEANNTLYIDVIEDDNTSNMMEILMQDLKLSDYAYLIDVFKQGNYVQAAAQFITKKRHFKDENFPKVMNDCYVLASLYPAIAIMMNLLPYKSLKKKRK